MSSRILASASDDKDIILWDPFRYEKLLVLHSGHRANIFSVKVRVDADSSLESSSFPCLAMPSEIPIDFLIV